MHTVQTGVQPAGKWPSCTWLFRAENREQIRVDWAMQVGGRAVDHEGRQGTE